MTTSESQSRDVVRETSVKRTGNAADGSASEGRMNMDKSVVLELDVQSFRDESTYSEFLGMGRDGCGANSEEIGIVEDGGTEWSEHHTGDVDLEVLGNVCEVAEHERQRQFASKESVVFSDEIEERR